MTDLHRREVLVPVAEADPREFRAHREDVVRRLLQRGLSRETLRALLPGWDTLIDRIDAEVRSR